MLSTSEANPDQEDDAGHTCIHVACQKGCLITVKELVINHNCSITKGNKERGATAIHLSAFSGHLNVVKFLCTRPNFNPSMKDKNGVTALHCACQANYLEVVKYLVLEQNCSSHMPDNNGKTPIHVAVISNSVDVLNFFKEKNFDTKLPEGLERLSRFEEVAHRFHSVHRSGNDKISIRRHVVDGNMNLVRADIASNPSLVQSLGPHNETLLHCASLAGHLRIVKYLVEEHKCDINAKTIDGSTPIHNSAEKGHTSSLEFLTSQPKCNVEIRDKRGYTPLHLAAKNGHLEICKIICSVAESPEVTDNHE